MKQSLDAEVARIDDGHALDNLAGQADDGKPLDAEAHSTSGEGCRVKKRVDNRGEDEHG